MNNSKFIRLSGWLFIVGAIAFLRPAILQLDYGARTISPLMTNTFFWAPVLLAVGLLGLRVRYKIGGSVLLFGAIVGGLLLIVGTLGQTLTPYYSVAVIYFGVWTGGLFVLHLCLFIFGIVMFIKKPLPRWNWLPLFAGMWVPLLPLLAAILKGTMEGSPYSNMEKIVIIAIFVSMTVAQVMLGYMLQADGPLAMEPA
jgi:hypothetical protein